MENTTLQQQIVATLEKTGCYRIESRSDKYIVLKRPGMANCWFIGKAGALRVGVTASSSVGIRQGKSALTFAQNLARNAKAQRE